MSTNLFHVPSHLFGMPLFGFGLLLLVFAIATAVWVYIALRRPGGKAEVLGALPVLAIVFAVILAVPRVFPEGFPVRGYGVMLVIASASGLMLAYVRMKQAGIDTDLLFSLAIGMFIFGIAGGRVFYVIEYWERIYAPKPLGEALWAALKYANGGLVVYGALFGATIYFVWFCYRNRLSLLAMADLVAPSLLVGLALGRIGCLLNGCCFGGVCDVPWAVTFPQQGQLAPRDPQQEEAEERQYFNSPPYDAQVTHGDFFGMHIVERDDKLVVNRVFAGSAAAEAGIEADDQIVSLAGYEVKTPENVAESLREAANYSKPLMVRVEGKAPVTLPSTLTISGLL